MNGDTLEVMKAISDFRQEATESIGKLHSEFSSHKANVDIRIKNIEDTQTKTDKRQWVHSTIVFAASLIHHDLGRWLNWKL